MKAYPEYKPSGIDWLGEIPSHWSISKLKHYISISNGSDPSSEGDIPVYGTGELPFKTCGEFKVGPTVLLGRKGSIDTPHWVDGKYWNVDTAFDTKVIANYNMRYFWYFANILDINPYKSTTAVPSMTQSAYDNMLIPVPLIEEQESIAAYLDDVTGKVDALIAEKQKQVEDLRAYRTSLITETVTRGLNPNAPLCPSGIDWLGEIPEHWEITKLKYVSTVQTGSTPSTSIEAYWDKPVKNWFTPGDFISFRLSSSNRKVSEQAFNKGACRIFPKGSILLVGIGATLGKVGIVTVECSANQQVNAVTFNDKIYPLYGAYFLSSCHDTLNSVSNASTLAILNQDQTKQFSIVIPPLSEQQAIAEFLDVKTEKIDALIDELTKQLDELAEYKKAVISEAVTGKVDVRDWTPKS